MSLAVPHASETWRIGVMPQPGGGPDALQLPSEIWTERIVPMMSLEEVGRLSRVSRLFHDMLQGMAACWLDEWHSQGPDLKQAEPPALAQGMNTLLESDGINSASPLSSAVDRVRRMVQNEVFLESSTAIQLYRSRRNSPSQGWRRVAGEIRDQVLKEWFQRSRPTFWISREGWLSERECAHFLVRHDPRAVEAIPPVAQSPELVHLAIKRSPWALLSCDERYLSDRDTVRLAVSQTGMLLRFCHVDLRDDEELVRLALRTDLDALEWASERLQQDSAMQALSGNLASSTIAVDRSLGVFVLRQQY
jgi:hypothetical protein